MPDFKVNPQPWMKAAVNVADDALVKALVDDFRSYNPAPRSTLSPPATVRVVGAGNVVGGDVGPQHRPVDATNSGWQEPPRVNDWRPPGLEHMDRMMDAQDTIDKAQRIRELAEAAAVQRALQPVEPKEQQPKVQEPKERGSKK
jgi:hypothetical protein